MPTATATRERTIEVRLRLGSSVTDAVNYLDGIVTGIYKRIYNHADHSLKNDDSSLKIERRYNERSRRVVLSYNGQLPEEVIDYLRDVIGHNGTVECEEIVIERPNGRKIKIFQI